MKYLLHFSAICLLCLLSINRIYSEDKTRQTEKTIISENHSETLPIIVQAKEDQNFPKNLSIEISSIKNLYQLAEPVIVDVTFKNISERIVYYEDNDVYLSISPYVFDMKDKTIPYTLFGKSRFNLGGDISGSTIRNLLKPNEFKCVKILINCFYDMTIPQKYKIVIKKTFYSENQSFYCFVGSKPLIVTVVPSQTTYYTGTINDVTSK